MNSDEVTFKQELQALHQQVYKPMEIDDLGLEGILPGRRLHDFSETQDDHVLLQSYLELEPGAQSLARLGEDLMGIFGAQAVPVGQARVINAIYSIFGPFHAQGPWFDIPTQIYVPICSVICLDAAAAQGIQSEISYSTGGSSTSTVKVKLAGAGFSGTRIETIRVSSQYPATKGSQQVAAPANMEARIYHNPSNGQKAYRIRIKSIGCPSHIGKSSKHFVVPNVKHWTRGDFGSSIGAGTVVTFDVKHQKEFVATVPINIWGFEVNLSYTVSQSDNLSLKAKALVRGIFDQLTVDGAAYALKFSLKT